MNICMECYEEYTNGSVKPYPSGRVMCPKPSCSGDVVEIDELIFPAIIELNKKGYKTRNSCSGHFKEHYIHFYVVIHGHIDLYEVPNCFSVEHTSLLTDYDVAEDVTIIRFVGDDTLVKNDYTYMDVIERMLMITEINIKFLNWVESRA